MKSIGVLCLLGVVYGQLRIDPLVSTKVGLIRGLRAEDGYSKFLGIPYAVVDETNPFGPSTPQPNFIDVFEAFDDSEECPQIFLGVATGSTQCLTLNVYVPSSATSQNRLPVMIWIHGGAFVEGNKTVGANPVSILRHDVILVSINYRLGVYGFMCLDIPEIPGNQGLKDQILALRWINENIEAFGGDSNNITIFGESAGAMSVNLHLFTSYEKLFNKAIIQSGPALSYWMMVESDTTIPLRLAEKLGFNTDDINQALTYLSRTDPKLVVAAAFDENISNSAGNNQPLTKPCVEKSFEGVENFISEHPMNIRTTKNVPVIIGHNDYEFGFQYEKVSADFFDSYNFNEFSYGFKLNETLDTALEAIKQFYIGDEIISEDVRFKIIDFGSDLIFNYPTQRMSEQLLDSGIKDVYRYVFSYSGGRNILKNMLNMTGPGATHFDDLGYLFDFEVSDKETPEDDLVVDRITKLWTNFAKYGNPTPETSDLIPVIWTPMTKITHTYLDINSELTVRNRPFHARMAFWDLFYKLYGKYQIWYKSPSE